MSNESPFQEVEQQFSDFNDTEHKEYENKVIEKDKLEESEVTHHKRSGTKMVSSQDQTQEIHTQFLMKMESQYGKMKAMETKMGQGIDEFQMQEIKNSQGLGLTSSGELGSSNFKFGQSTGKILEESLKLNPLADKGIPVYQSKKTPIYDEPYALMNIAEEPSQRSLITFEDKDIQPLPVILKRSESMLSHQSSSVVNSLIFSKPHSKIVSHRSNNNDDLAEDINTIFAQQYTVTPYQFVEQQMGIQDEYITRKIIEILLQTPDDIEPFVQGIIQTIQNNQNQFPFLQLEIFFTKFELIKTQVLVNLDSLKKPNASILKCENILKKYTEELQKLEIEIDVWDLNQFYNPGQIESIYGAFNNDVQECRQLLQKYKEIIKEIKNQQKVCYKRESRYSKLAMPPHMFSTFGDKETTLKKHKSQQNLRKPPSLRVLRRTRSKKEMPYVCRETASTRMKMRDPHQEVEGATRKLMISDDAFFNRRLTCEKKSEKALKRAKSGSRIRLSKIDMQPRIQKQKLRVSQSLQGIFTSRDSKPNQINIQIANGLLDQSNNSYQIKEDRVYKSFDNSLDISKLEMSSQMNEKQNKINKRQLRKNSEKILKKAKNENEKLNLIIKDLLKQNKQLKTEKDKSDRKYREMKNSHYSIVMEKDAQNKKLSKINNELQRNIKMLNQKSEFEDNLREKSQSRKQRLNELKKDNQTLVEQIQLKDDYISKLKTRMSVQQSQIQQIKSLENPDRNLKLKMRQMRDMFELKIDELETQIEILEKARDKFRDQALDLKQQLKKQRNLANCSTDEGWGSFGQNETRTDSQEHSKMSIYDKLKTYQKILRKKDNSAQSMQNLNEKNLPSNFVSFQSFKNEPKVKF